MNRCDLTATLACLLALCLVTLPGRSLAYPLDGYESTGIERLRVQRLIQEGAVKGKKRPTGELLPLAKVDLRLLDHPNFELPPVDAALTEIGMQWLWFVVIVWFGYWLLTRARRKLVIQGG